MTIRNAQPADAERLLEIYSYYVENTAITFEIETPSAEEFRGRIENITKKFPYLVIEDGGVIQGYAYANYYRTRAAYRFCCELSIYLDRSARGSGFGRRLYEELEDRLRAQGFKNLYACISDPEVEDEYLTRNSEQFHQHMGYTKVAKLNKCGYKFGRWYNSIYMEKMIGAHD